MTTQNSRRGLRAALLGAIAAAAIALPSHALVIEQWNPEIGPVLSTQFVRLDAAAQQVDRDYVAGMRPHHAGALTMSRDYLANPGRSSPLLQQLSRAIAANQVFEIAVLDEVRRNLDQPPVRFFGVAMQPVATENMGGERRFFKTPIPSPLSWSLGPVSVEDVRFAKAMIIHHEGAVQMAREYHANPSARNPFLHRMNTDVITDQTQEIALLRMVVAAFPGDASRIEVDPSMVHGMEGMNHGAAGAGHAGHGPRAVGQGGHDAAHGGSHAGQ
ncbi:MAG: DUF305 domain-containing protein, partial [Acetobacteraceae bacterium]|nr:DUF305 domain-containing protein [Acetobacteraceae bacterium]